MYNIKPSTVKVEIHVFPEDEIIKCNFSNDRTFWDLKEELEKTHNMKNGTYYFEVNDCIIYDYMPINEYGYTYDININAIRSDCVKIKVVVREENNKFKMLEKYMYISDFKVIRGDEFNIVKVCYNHI